MPKPETMHLNDLYWQLSTPHVWSATENVRQAEKRVAKCHAAVDWFNGLSYEDQQHVKLLMESSEREGYESCQSEHGEGP
jgi:hypothetical protein